MTSIVLAINTAADICSVALQNDATCLVLSSSSPRKHAHEVLPMIQELLKQAEISLPQLDAIATVTGPGSFTGLRIGSAVTQGLAFGIQRQVVGVSYLAMLARLGYRTYRSPLLVASCMHAREDEYYFACYQDDGSQSPVAVVADRIQSSEQILSTTAKHPDLKLAGDGWLQPAFASLAQVTTILSVEPPPDASVLCELAIQALHAGMAQADPALALPVYLKDDMAYRTV
jgi:tRNA threonylcarbamoyladenosine biosynthesis protein TsaB